MANTPYGPVDSDVSPALLPLAAQQAVSVSTTVAASSGLPAGTTFPGAPSDGDIFIYTADATNGVKWAFQYDSSQTTYKWVFVGGDALFSEVATGENTGSAAYVALATAGPSIALPRAGDYDVTIGTRSNATVASDTYMSYDIGGTAAVDTDAIYLTPQAVGYLSGSRTRRKTGLTAVTLTSKYRTQNPTATFGNRWMSVVPVRVI